MLAAVLWALGVTPLLLWLIKEISMGMCLNDRSMAGKTVVITGGSDGIGFETAVELAKRGARVIVGCRRFQMAKDKILGAFPKADVESFALDLGSTKSVEQFAGSVRGACDRIDILINNAGVIAKASDSDDQKDRRQMTTDGKHEFIMGTNYFGHAQMNHLLLDLVKAAGEKGDFARIILVSSTGLFSSNIDDRLDLEMEETKFGYLPQYCNSKMAQFLYCLKMAEIFDKEGCNVSISSLHPGFVRTPLIGMANSTRAKVIAPLFWIVGKSALQGAQTTLYLATEDKPREYFHGKWFADCRDYTSLVLKKAPVALVDKFWERTNKALSL